MRCNEPGRPVGKGVRATATEMTTCDKATHAELRVGARGSATVRHARRKSSSYNRGVDLYWADEDAAYIRSRSARYSGALDIEPAWTWEVLADDRLVELSPIRHRALARADSSGTRRPRGRCSSSSSTATWTETCTA